MAAGCRSLLILNLVMPRCWEELHIERGNSEALVLPPPLHFSSVILVVPLVLGVNGSVAKDARCLSHVDLTNCNLLSSYRFTAHEQKHHSRGKRKTETRFFERRACAVSWRCSWHFSTSKRSHALRRHTGEKKASSWLMCYFTAVKWKFCILLLSGSMNSLAKAIYICWIS